MLGTPAFVSTSGLKYLGMLGTPAFVITSGLKYNFLI